MNDSADRTRAESSGAWEDNGAPGGGCMPESRGVPSGGGIPSGGGMPSGGGAPPSIFNDVIGPVMRGPSSSHCAAAVRLGRLVRELMGGELERVQVEFHPGGSLATTHETQGSDMGLFGGLLGWEATDERLVDSSRAITEEGISVDIRITDFPASHPNTYRITVANSCTRHTVVALSTGGGMIRVVEIDGVSLRIDGDYHETLVFLPQDQDQDQEQKRGQRQEQERELAPKQGKGQNPKQQVDGSAYDRTRPESRREEGHPATLPATLTRELLRGLAGLPPEEVFLHSGSGARSGSEASPESEAGPGLRILQIKSTRPLPPSALDFLADRFPGRELRTLSRVMPIGSRRKMWVPFRTASGLLEYGEALAAKAAEAARDGETAKAAEAAEDWETAKAERAAKTAKSAKTEKDAQAAGGERGPHAGPAGAPTSLPALWELAAEYESVRGDIGKDEVMERMEGLVRLLEESIEEGLNGTEFDDRILGPQAPLYEDRWLAGALLEAGVLNRIVLYVTTLMEVKSAMGVIVAAPTAGACGALPGACLAIGHENGLSVRDIAKGMLAAGAVGLLIAARSTFAAEVCGCQAECGSASGMTAAALVTLAGGDTRQALAAASMALQNTLGMVCDPVANRVEVPCLGKNVLAATNALASANMVLAGFDAVIPLDEVIEAMDAVGRSLPRELRCTALGGLSVTPTARTIEAKLAGAKLTGAKLTGATLASAKLDKDG